MKVGVGGGGAPMDPPGGPVTAQEKELHSAWVH